MKLLEFLVKELPKHGGWPSWVHHIRKHSGDDRLSFYDRDGFISGSHPEVYCQSPIHDSFITLDQYEAALAASQQPITIAVFHSNDGSHDSFGATTVEELQNSWRGDKVGGEAYHCDKHYWRVHFLTEQQPAWDGEGLPPVGVDIEVNSPRKGWTKAKVTAVTENYIVAQYEDGVEFAGPHRQYDSVNSEFSTVKPANYRKLITEAERKRQELAKALAHFLDSETEVDSCFLSKDLIGFYDAIVAGKIPGVGLTN